MRGTRAGQVSTSNRMLLLEEGEEQVAERVGAGGELEVRVTRKGMKKSVADEEVLRLRRIRAEDEDTTSLFESV